MLPLAVTPVRQVILKLHSRCNLACSYCYVYEHADQSWRRQPRVMAPEIIERTADRIAQHARGHALDTVTVVLHGGEPLLAGPRVVEHAVTAIRAALPASTRLDVRAQTNGLLLDDEMLEVLRRQDVYVGVSLDGDALSNDRNRRFRNGEGSHAAVARGLARLRAPRYRHLFSGLLCTIDIASDPIEVYRGLLEFAPPRIDLLLPHGNWTTPPPGREPGSVATPYADWLSTVFDRWYGAPRQETEIRLFQSILSLLLGGPSTSEAFGLEPSDLITVETDGSIEQGDALKTTADGLAATGLHVAGDSFDDALNHRGIRARQAGIAGLAPECRRCPVVSVCGGGLYAHRFRAPADFLNPTVYCPDQLALIGHIRDRLEADVRALATPAEPAPIGTDRYRWTAEQFRQLGAGYGDAAGLAVLRSAQSSKRRLLLGAVADLASRRPEWTEADCPDAWRLLNEALTGRPAAADQVLSYPFVDAWSQATLSHLTGETPERANLAYLGGLAAAAAVRAGVPFKLRVPAVDGQVWLPTLGLAYDLPEDSAELSGTATTLAIRSGERVLLVSSPYTTDEPGWLAQHRLEGESPAGAFAATLEDLDPYRSCFKLPPAPRLTGADRARLRQHFAQAWRLIGTHHPRHAAAMRGGLRGIVPLLAPPLGSQSAAAQNAFGAIAISPTVDAAELALLMIHETQHMKLGAIFDVVDLYDGAHPGLYHAPWRADPRPAGALFQGAYAHLGVADFWRVRRTLLTDAEAADADFEFAYWLEQTRRATATLAGSDALTEPGRRFVAAMATTLDGWREEELRTEVATGVSDVVDAQAVDWRLTNTRPARADTDRLVAAYRAGGPPPSVSPAVSAAGTAAGPARLDKLAVRLRFRLRGGPANARELPTASTADHAYLTGDLAGAVDLYCRDLRRNPMHNGAWAGLALSLRGTRDPGAAFLLDRPDLARAVFTALPGGRGRPSPARLLGWLAGAA